MSTNGNENQNYPNAYDQYNAQQTNQPMYGAGGQPVPSYNGNEYMMQQNNKAGKGLGIASLVLGILALLSGWMFIGGLFGLIGLILGVMSLRQAKKAGAPKGLAITGIVLSILGLISAIVMGILVAFVFQNVDIPGAMEACQQYQNNQQQLEQCMRDYVEANQNK